MNRRSKRIKSKSIKINGHRYSKRGFGSSSKDAIKDTLIIVILMVARSAINYDISESIRLDLRNMRKATLQYLGIDTLFELLIRLLEIIGYRTPNKTAMHSALNTIKNAKRLTRELSID